MTSAERLAYHWQRVAGIRRVQRMLEDPDHVSHRDKEWLRVHHPRPTTRQPRRCDRL